MSLLTASTIVTATAIPSVRSESQCRRQTKLTCSSPLGLRPLNLHFQPFDKRKPITQVGRRRLLKTATRAAEQTQTVTRQSSTITVAPSQGKEKSPDLDDGGSGLPPRDDDGGGGGGGGGGWAGGFFFFGFLAFLGLLKDEERDGGEQFEKDRQRR